ncbi:GTP-binding protein [Tilletiopsis washingtonensis]|uniref:ADP-ribosylation factor-like protein 2 n=1 Tax=Tilletiopsis washingtonensis TaxID=58919 RepID=A0A316Z038_9BASI|nr:GTP-binding protein [Tilletiopsis washingtonensis]PWN95077.1 GTP-binding protein [Tilletiopsis washingtonensis]
MGLLTIIRKNKFKDRELRLLFLGLDNSGKSSIVRRILGEDIAGVSPTLGFDIRTVVHRGYTLNIWDVGGQKSLRPYWRNYFERTDALVWVVDSGDRARLDDAREELWGVLGEERLAGASILIFANKQDIVGALSAEEIRRALALDAISSHAWRIQPCSAATGAQLGAGVDWAVEDVGRRMYFGGGGGVAPPEASKEAERRGETGTA